MPNNKAKERRQKSKERREKSKERRDNMREKSKERREKAREKSKERREKAKEKREEKSEERREKQKEKRKERSRERKKKPKKKVVIQTPKKEEEEEDEKVQGKSPEEKKTELIVLIKLSKSSKTKEIEEKIEELAKLPNGEQLNNHQWLEILLALLEGTPSDSADKQLMESSSFIVRKDLINNDNSTGEKILDAMLNRDIANANKSPDILKEYNEFMELIEKKFSQSASPKMSSASAELLQKGVKTKNPYYAACLSGKMFEHINFGDMHSETDKKHLITKVCKHIQKHPKGKKYFKDILEGPFWEKFYNSKHFTPQSSTENLIKPTFALFVFLDGTDLMISTRFSTKVYYSILHYLLAEHCTNQSAVPHIEEFLPYVKKRAEQNASPEIQERCNYIMNHVKTEMPQPEIAPDEIEEVVEEPLDFAQMRFKYNDDENSRADIHKHIPTMVQLLSDQTSEQQPHALKLLEDIARKNPKELLPFDGLDGFVGNDKADTTYIITRIAQENPQVLWDRDVLDDYLNQAENSETKQDMANVIIYQIYPPVARLGKEQAKDIFMFEYNEFNIREEDYDSLVPVILYHWQELAYLYAEVLQEQRDNGYLEMSDFLEDPSTQAQAQHLVDTVDGINPLNRSNLTQHKEIIQTPRWIAQVSEMLNSEEENDWHIVAKRIGFSPYEIEKWSEEAYPAEAMLFEFYSNNKIATIDATYFLLSVLKQLERADVVGLIDNTGKDSENDKPEHERLVDPEMVYDVVSTPERDNTLPPVV